VKQLFCKFHTFISRRYVKHYVKLKPAGASRVVSRRESITLLSPPTQ